MQIQSIQRGVGFLSLAFAFTLLVGCAGYSRKSEMIVQAYKMGNMSIATMQVSLMAQKRQKTRDGLVWHLEEGAIYRAAGDYERSNTALEEADEMIADYEEKAKTSITGEAKAAVTNLRYLPYRGYAYDKIMVSCYKGMNFLLLGDLEAARTELRRAYERQSDAASANAARIEEAQEEQQKEAENNKQVKVDETKNSEGFQNAIASNYADLEQFSAYENYVNPFAEFLQGVYFLAEGIDGADIERSVKCFERLTGMVGENPYVAEDYALAEQVASGDQLSSVTYVIFETGLAPSRSTIRIDLPLFLVNDRVDYVGAAFPKLNYHDSYLSKIYVAADDEEYPTEILADMDAVVRQEFKNELPTIITKTLIAAAAKAAAAYALNEATRGQNAWVNLGTRIATTSYQVAMNQADERTWRTLPKQFQYCRFPTPESMSIEIKTDTPGVAGRTVQLEDGMVNVVVVKSVSPSSGLIVSQFALKKSPTEGVEVQ